MEVGADKYVRKGSANKLIYCSGIQYWLEAPSLSTANEISLFSSQLLGEMMPFLRHAISSLGTTVGPL